MRPYYAILVLLAAALGTGPLGVPMAVSTAEASELYQWHGSDHDGGGRGWDRGSRDWDRGGRDWDRWDGHRPRFGGWDGWRRARHSDWGDCFRTPWGLACETWRPGVYRVRDRHPGDEPGPDCDVLIIEEWGWRCYDSPRR